jgi:hypothetical protein
LSQSLSGQFTTRQAGWGCVRGRQTAGSKDK